MSGARYDLDEVRLALKVAPRSILNRYGIAGSGKYEIESGACPQAQHGRRRSFVYDLRKHIWRCFPCGTGGDLLTLVALAEKRDPKRDFPEVVELAAKLCGVRPIDDGDDHEARRRHIAERLAAEKKREAREAEIEANRRRQAIERAKCLWPSLLARHRDGERYLDGRGIDVTRVAQLGAVRYDSEGNVAVALHASDGTVRNVVRRNIDPRTERKVVGLPDAPTAGTLVGSVSEIVEESLVILTEGVIDSLTALCVKPWRGAVVLGAHGADNMPVIARAVAPIAKAKRCRLLLVAHDDDAGERVVIEAGRIAIAAGLRLDSDFLVVDLRGANDLNEAWLRGWLP